MQKLACLAISKSFKGGGVRMVRYNCEIKKLPRGYLLMHPGRLTHQHEGVCVGLCRCMFVFVYVCVNLSVIKPHRLTGP